MKKLLFSYISLFTLLLCYTLPSNAQQAFYIYRNDGGINTFITTEIDSMTYSRLDLDSVVHDNYVVHEVYTPDSIYRIPIELIDSVGFVTPETVYKPGVRILEGEVRNYIISRNELTLMFHSSTPSNLLPHVGDKLVTTEVDDVITNAFVGQISVINTTSGGIEVVCEPVDLTDVFETYYGIIRKTDEPVSARRRSIADGFYGTNGTRTFNPGKLTLDLINTHNVSITYNKDDELSYSLDNARAALSLTPVIDYNAYLIVNKTYGVNVSVTAVGNYTVEELFALSGNVDLNFDFPFFKKPIPIPEALIDIEFEVGFFGEAQGKLSIDQVWTQKYKHVFHWEWSSKGHESLQKVHDFTNTSNTHTGKVALNGSLAVGGYGKVGVAFIATSSLDIAEVGLKYKGGVSLEGTYVPYKRDEEYAKKSTDLYNQIKDREIAVYGFRGLTFEAKLFKWSVSKEIPNFLNIPFNKREPWGAIRSVPLFSDTKLTKDEIGTYYSSTNITGEVQPTDVGFALINQANNEDATYSYSVYDYKGPKAEAYASFFDKPSSNKYTVYPLVKYMGMELIAEPSAEIDEAEIMFKQAEIVSVDSESKYNGDGEYLFTWYTTKFKYVIQISGADLIDYIQPIIYDNGTWTYNGGKTKVPGNGLFSVTTTMSYDNDANMNWETGYCITLKDGSIIYSINTLQFGGTPESPTISVGGSASSAANSRRSIKQAERRSNVPTFGELVIKEIR